MTKRKKYDYRVVTDDTGWRAEVIRQVTSKQTMVSKSQDGFASETDAQAWAQQALQSFAENLSERNKRRSEKRQLKAKQLAEKQHQQALIKAAKLAEREADKQQAESEIESVWKQPKEQSNHDQ